MKLMFVLMMYLVRWTPWHVVCEVWLYFDLAGNLENVDDEHCMHMPCCFKTQKFPWLCWFVVHVLVAWRICCLPCYVIHSIWNLWFDDEHEMPCCLWTLLNLPRNLFDQCVVYCCLVAIWTALSMPCCLYVDVWVLFRCWLHDAVLPCC